MRQVERRNTQRVLIVSHGLTARLFVMRFMHLTVAEFETLANLQNCDVVTISNKIEDLGAPIDFARGQWGVHGLRFRDRQ